MLYLPRVLTAPQLPEAPALIPVIDGEHQRGTIIASVVDEPFSATNSVHLKIANAVETSMADRGLLPLFTDL